MSNENHDQVLIVERIDPATKETVGKQKMTRREYEATMKSELAKPWYPKPPVPIDGDQPKESREEKIEATAGVGPDQPKEASPGSGTVDEAGKAEDTPAEEKKPAAKKSGGSSKGSKKK